MRQYIFRRSIQNVIVLLGLITILFMLFRLMPGDPVSIIISAELTEEAQQALRKSWGLDQPLIKQYLLYLKNLVAGDFGMSFYHQVPVWEILSEKTVNTLILMIPGRLLGVVLGVFGGIYFAWRRGSRYEWVGVVMPPVIRAMPVFWLGILLLMAFSYGFNLFPNAGMRSIGSITSGWASTFLSVDFLWHLTLPLLCTAITSIPEPMLIMRSSLLETKGEDFLELIEAKGVRERVVLKHAVRNSMLPVLTWVFHMIGYAMAGTVLIEVVFAWPGLGRELVTAVENHDYPVCQAAFFVISFIVVGLNFILDLLYGFFDPRVVLD
jgi:peptide/nickel transport system permease protein